DESSKRQPAHVRLPSGTGPYSVLSHPARKGPPGTGRIPASMSASRRSDPCRTDTANLADSRSAANKSDSSSMTPATRPGSPSTTSVDDTVNPAGRPSPAYAVQSVTAAGSRPRSRRTEDLASSGVANGSEL